MVVWSWMKNEWSANGYGLNLNPWALSCNESIFRHISRILGGIGSSYGSTESSPQKESLNTNNQQLEEANGHEKSIKNQRIPS
jgi:hypothetical protein